VDAAISNRLAERLSQMSLRSNECENGEKILIDRNGRFMTRDDASAAMIEISMKAKVAGVLMKDCRDTAVVRLTEAGCTPFEIASITGHSLKTVTTILRHYFVPTATIADNAIAKLNRQNRKIVSRETAKSSHVLGPFKGEQNDPFEFSKKIW